MKKLKFFLLSSSILLTPAFAETITLPEVVVSATRIPTESKFVGSSVTVITRDDIERSQAVTLPDVLRSVPGLYMQQTGGPGGNTDIYIRGANANHTKVLVDGVDVSDPSTPRGTFDFGHFLASDLEQVEVLRGPQSGLYGSSGIGGVVNIITKKGAGKPRVSLTTEGGSFNTIRQNGQVSGSHERLSYFLSADFLRVGSMPVTPKLNVIPGRRKNDDSYENATVSTKLGYKVTEDLDLGLVARFTNTEARYTADDFTGPKSLRNRGENQQGYVRGTAHHVSFGGIFEQTFGITHSSYRRRDTNPTASVFTEPTFYSGDRNSLDWQGVLKLNQDHSVVMGVEHMREAINGNQNVAAHTSNTGLYAGLNSRFGERLSTSANIRYDKHEQFGSKFTYRLAAAYLILETGTKLKASYGTGFKAPSLDQLFHDYPAYGFTANRNLRPETSTGYDIGFEQKLFNDKVVVGSSYFHNDIKNLIAYNNSFTTYINVGQATTQGVESFVSWQPWDFLTLKADHTYTLADNEVTDQALLRRPKHKFGAHALWTVNPQTKISASVEHTSGWVDGNRDFSVSRFNTKGFTLVNVTASHAINKNLTAFARVENALDERYEQPTGFQRPRFGAYAGLKFTFGGE